MKVKLFPCDGIQPVACNGLLAVTGSVGFTGLKVDGNPAQPLLFIIYSLF